MSVALPTQPFNDDDVIDLRALFSLLWSRRWLIVACTVVVFGIFAVVAFVTTPVYRATVILAAASADSGNPVESLLGQFGGVAALAGLSLGGGGSDTEEAIAVLKSREFTEKFINDLNLMPRLFAKRWDATRQAWKDPQSVPTPYKAYKRFHNQVRSVTPDKKTGLITLQVDWMDREEGTQWANELVRRVNDEMRARAINKASASVGFLEKELQSTSNVSTREAISRLLEAQVKQRMLANVTQEYAFRILDRALPPDADDPVRPQKLKLLAAGIFIGFMVGVIWAFLAGWGGIKSTTSSSGATPRGAT